MEVEVVERTTNRPTGELIFPACLYSKTGGGAARGLTLGDFLTINHTHRARDRAEAVRTAFSHRPPYLSSTAQEQTLSHENFLLKRSKLIEALLETIL